MLSILWIFPFHLWIPLCHLWKAQKNGVKIGHFSLDFRLVFSPKTTISCGLFPYFFFKPQFHICIIHSTCLECIKMMSTGQNWPRADTLSSLPYQSLWLVLSSHSSPAFELYHRFIDLKIPFVSQTKKCIAGKISANNKTLRAISEDFILSSNY